MSCNKVCLNVLFNSIRIGIEKIPEVAAIIKEQGYFWPKRKSFGKEDKYEFISNIGPRMLHIYFVKSPHPTNNMALLRLYYLKFNLSLACNQKYKLIEMTS